MYSDGSVAKNKFYLKLKDEDVIPICSIRLKPEKLDHCVAWGKVLFEQIFIENGNKNVHDNDDKKEKLFDENMPKKTDNFEQILNSYFPDIILVISLYV